MVGDNFSTTVFAVKDGPFDLGLEWRESLRQKIICFSHGCFSSC